MKGEAGGALAHDGVCPLSERAKIVVSVFVEDISEIADAGKHSQPPSG